MAGLLGPLLPTVCYWVYEWYFRRNILDCTTRELERSAADAANLSMVHVVYSSDREGFVGLLASMLSLSANAKEPSQCTIHLIVSDDDMAHAESLVRCFGEELDSSRGVPTVLLHRLRAAPLPLSNRKSGPVADVQQSFARFYLHEYLPAAPRAVWLDYDTIVQSDIAPLYRKRMSHAIAAVPYERFNVYGTCSKTRDLQALLKRSGSSFNPGVMLVDLQRWRSGAIVRGLERWQRRTAGCGDMIPLNLAFQGAFDRLDWSWNVHPLGAQFMYVPAICMESARIVHWAGPFKCWREYRAWEQLASLSPKMCALYESHRPRRCTLP